MSDIRILVEKEEKEIYRAFAKANGFSLSSLVRTSLKIVMEKPELLTGGLLDVNDSVMDELREQKARMNELTQNISKLMKAIVEKKEDFDPIDLMDFSRFSEQE